MFTFHLLLASQLPPAEDELYYWCWSRELQLSYYDHPPLCAYLVRLSTSVLGDTLVGIRFFACLGAVVVLGVVAQLADRRMLGWLVASPVFLFGSILLTPDTPLLVFWSLYALWLVQINRRLEDDAGQAWGWWLMGGLLLGLGLLGKYTMALAVPCAALTFARPGLWRRAVPGLTLHLASAGVLTLPVLIFNYQLDFVPIRFQWAHASANDKPAPWYGVFEYLAVQGALVGLLPLAVWVWAIRHTPRLWAEVRLRVCWCLFVVPYAFFLYKACGKRLEANWPLACYLTCWPLALAMLDSMRSLAWRRALVVGGFAPAAAVSVALVAHAIMPLGVSPRHDRLTRLHAQYQLVQQAAADIQSGGVEPIYALTLQWTSYLRFAGVRAEQLPLGTRPSHFTVGRPTQTAEVIYVFADCPLPACYRPVYGEPQILAEYPLLVRGQLLTKYYLSRYQRVGPGVEPTLTPQSHAAHSIFSAR